MLSHRTFSGAGGGGRYARSRALHALVGARPSPGRSAFRALRALPPFRPPPLPEKTGERRMPLPCFWCRWRGSLRALPRATRPRRRQTVPRTLCLPSAPRSPSFSTPALTWKNRRVAQASPLFLVPGAGVEPARHCWQRILSPPRLPIPTHRRGAPGALLRALVFSFVAGRGGFTPPSSPRRALPRRERPRPASPPRERPRRALPQPGSPRRALPPRGLPPSGDPSGARGSRG